MAALLDYVYTILHIAMEILQPFVYILLCSSFLLATCLGWEFIWSSQHNDQFWGEGL